MNWITKIIKAGEKIKTALHESLVAIEAEFPIDMAEIDLKNAWYLLGEIIGDTSSTSLLDELFSKFCLGK